MYKNNQLNINLKMFHNSRIPFMQKGKPIHTQYLKSYSDHKTFCQFIKS